MKLTKRIIALTIVLCTLGAMMIPGVSVSAETVKETHSYDFGAIANDYGLTNDDYTNANQLVNSGYLMPGGEKVNAAYETKGWAFAAGDRGGLEYALPTAFGIKARSSGTYANFGFAIKLQSPGSGEYDVTLKFIRHKYAETADNLDVYIVPLPDFNFFDYNAADNNTFKLRQAISGQELPGGAKLDDSTRVISTSLFVADSVVLGTETFTYTFEADKEYMVVFVGTEAEATAGRYSEIYNMELSREVVVEDPEASIEGKVSGTLADVVAAAAEGDIIKLGKDVTLAAELNTNATLDLNGFTLTAGENAVACKVIDSSDGNGCLVADEEQVAIETVDQIALYSDGGYYFYNYIFASKGNKENEGKVSFWSQLTFVNADAYAKVAAGSELTVGFAVSANGGEAKYFDVAPEDVAAWAAVEDASAYGFYLTVGGFGALEENCELSVVPYVNGIEATAIEYSYTVAQ